MKKKFNDYSITPQHLGKVIRDNNITRKRTTRRHYPETLYGKSINLKPALCILNPIPHKPCAFFEKLRLSP